LAVIQILAAPGEVGPNGLDMAVRMGTDPHLLPRGRDHQLPYPAQSCIIDERFAVRGAI
jgi:hypothetical protein